MHIGAAVRSCRHLRSSVRPPHACIGTAGAPCRHSGESCCLRVPGLLEQWHRLKLPGNPHRNHAWGRLGTPCIYTHDMSFLYVPGFLGQQHAVRARGLHAPAASSHMDYWGSLFSFLCRILSVCAGVLSLEGLHILKSLGTGTATA